MNIFPFSLPRQIGDRLFIDYIHSHKKELDEKYGTWVLTTVNGVTGNFKLWHWTGVSVEVTSPVDVTFKAFDSDGGKSTVIKHRLDDPSVLTSSIRRRRRDLAEHEYQHRENARAQAEIDKIEQELFGD